MPNFKKYFNQRLTLGEAAKVLILIGMAAGLVYLAYQFISARILDARVAAVIPKVCDAVRQQRAVITQALEAYKEQFGAYPPDHLINDRPATVDPITNTLIYELAGVLHDPARKQFQLGGMEWAEERFVTNFLQIERFKNCADRLDLVKNFLPKAALTALQLHDDPDVFALGFNLGGVDLPSDLFWEIEVTPWRYVRSAATNNPGKFDLWIELKHGDRVVTVGNWKAVE